MGDNYNVSVVNELANKEYKEKCAVMRKGAESYFLDENFKKAPVLVTSKGIIGEDDLYRVAEAIALRRGKEPTEVFSRITGNQRSFWQPIRKLEKVLVKSLLALFTLGLISFGAIKAKLITGLAIGELSGNAVDVGIFICVIGILLGIYFVYIKKRK